MWIKIYNDKNHEIVKVEETTKEIAKHRNGFLYPEYVYNYNYVTSEDDDATVQTCIYLNTDILHHKLKSHYSRDHYKDIAKKSMSFLREIKLNQLLS